MENVLMLDEFSGIFSLFFRQSSSEKHENQQDFCCSRNGLEAGGNCGAYDERTTKCVRDEMVDENSLHLLSWPVSGCNLNEPEIRVNVN